MIKNLPIFILLSLILPFKFSLFRVTDIFIILSIIFYFFSKGDNYTSIFKTLYKSILIICTLQPVYIIFNNDINILSSLIYSCRYLSLPCLIIILSNYYKKINTIEINRLIKKIEILITFYISINLIFYIYQIISGRFYGDYGLVTVGCNNATAFSAIQLISLFFVNTFVQEYRAIINLNNNKKSKLFSLNFLKSILLILMGIGLGSRSITAVFIFFILLKTFSYIQKYLLIFIKEFGLQIKIKYQYILKIALFTSVITSITLFLYQLITYRNMDLNRLLASLSFFNSNENIRTTRYEIINQELDKVPSFLNIFFGNGFAFVESLDGADVIRVGMHSQYSRLILEVGLIGLILFIIPFLIISKRQFLISIKELNMGNLQNYNFYSNLYIVNICYLLYFLSYDVLTISAGIIGISFTTSLTVLFKNTNNIKKNN